ncbi:hypothetical protein ACTXT7_016258 [Hymenolepis weldensis]
MTSENQKMQCTPQVLQFLMELRGKEVVKFIDREFNGYAGLAKALSSSPDKGLNETDILKHREIYGPNVIPQKPPKSIFRLIWEALQDITLLVLIGAAIISLGLSLYMKCSSKMGNAYRYFLTLCEKFRSKCKPSMESFE